MKHPFLERLIPEWLNHPKFKDFHPRHISTPLGYLDTRYHGMLLCAQHEFPSATPKEEIVIARNLTKSMVPTYFLDPTFMEAVIATSPKDHPPIGEIELPLPTMLIVLPDKESIDYFGYRVTFLSYTTAPSVEDANKHVFVFHCFLFPDDGKPLGYYGKMPSHETVDSISKYDYHDWTDEQNVEMDRVLGKDVGKDLARQPGTKLPSELEDRIIPDKCFSLLYRLFMILHATEKRYIEPGEQTRKERVYNGKVLKTSLWSPNFIGHSYRTKYDPGAHGTHKSPGMHWRIGHTRNQRHGKDNVFIKQIWIEPVLVNANKPQIAKTI